MSQSSCFVEGGADWAGEQVLLRQGAQDVARGRKGDSAGSRPLPTPTHFWWPSEWADPHAVTGHTPNAVAGGAPHPDSTRAVHQQQPKQQWGSPADPQPPLGAPISPQGGSQISLCRPHEPRVSRAFHKDSFLSLASCRLSQGSSCSSVLLAGRLVHPFGAGTLRVDLLQEADVCK